METLKICCRGYEKMQIQYKHFDLSYNINYIPFLMPRFGVSEVVHTAGGAPWVLTSNLILKGGSPFSNLEPVI